VRKTMFREYAVSLVVVLFLQRAGRQTLYSFVLFIGGCRHVDKSPEIKTRRNWGRPILWEL
jgi:hypothetical protein